MSIAQTGIEGAVRVPVAANRDGRGCLFEIFRQSWPGAFATVQWNACASKAGVVRGVHVHADYHEFYTLPSGRVQVGLVDIREDSPTFGERCQFTWSAADNHALAIPLGVGHMVYFLEPSVLVFGLSDYWKAENDVLGCRWDDPALGFTLEGEPTVSCRDQDSGSYAEMVDAYNAMRLRMAG